MASALITASPLRNNRQLVGRHETLSGRSCCVFMSLRRVPIFPLSILPLPGERQVLHIFEPRYILLFRALENMEIDDFAIAHTSRGNLTGLGTMMRLVVAERTGNGEERNAMVQGMDLVQIRSIQTHLPPSPGKPDAWPEGNIDPVPDWRNWQVSEDCKREWMEHWIEDRGDKMQMVPPDDLIGFLRQINAPTPLRSRLIRMRTEGARNQHLASWMKTQRLVRLQERHRQGPIFPN